MLCRWMKNFLLVFCALWTSSVSAREPLLLERHVVRDEQGWRQPVDAAVTLVPADWQTRSAIHWTRRCSADKLFDTRFVTQSTDGARGMQMLPGLRFEYFDVRTNIAAFNAVIPATPGSQAMMLAQEQQMQAKLQQQIGQWKQAMAGTDCHWSQALSARDILQSYVIPRRAPGARIVNETRLAELEANLRSQVPFGPSQVGARAWQDARQFRIEFMNGAIASEADVLIIAYGFIGESDPSAITLNTSHHTWTFPVITRWAPAGELDGMAGTFDMIASSWRYNPRWSRAIAEVRANISRMNREAAAKRHEIWVKAQQEVSDSQMQSWQYRQDTVDRSQQQLLDMINEVQPFTDPTTGYEVAMPIQYDEYFVSDKGQYLALQSGQDPAALYPDYVWTKMEPAR